ncbi:MAG: AAA family ATPase [Desulfurivibrionaceae bacterium]
MYLNYYNMAKTPFHITPDPEFLYLSPSHKEALGAIIYCISKKKGFVSVIGEVGTGKTTIIRSYLARSKRSMVKPIYVFNPSVSFAELLKTIFRELGIEPHNENVYDMVEQLHTVLIREFEQQHNIVLIIDEAQNMPVTTFERLRILSNLETPKEKLLQIILVGQPELAEMLAGKQLRQLNQRLAIRATLMPLSPQDSRDYILFRLAKVTPTPDDIFSNGALKRIIKSAQGSPRMLNILCDNALVAGYGYQQQRITGRIVKQVIADFEGKRRSPFFLWKYASLVGVLILGVSTLAGLHAFSPLDRLSFSHNEHSSDSNPAGIKTTTLPAQPQSIPETVISQNKATPLPGKVGRPRIPAGSTSSEAPAPANPAPANPAPANPTPSKPAPSEPAQAYAARADSAGQNRASMILVSRNEKKAIEPAAINTWPEEIRARKIKDGPTVRTIRNGEYLSQICLDVYGFVNDRIIQTVKENNPHIFDADLIFTGDIIYFPAPLESERIRANYQGGRQR